MKKKEQMHACSLDEEVKTSGPKHKEVLGLIRIAKGHLAGIEKMIQEDRYCIDISKQLLALISILKKANVEILKKHMETCVRGAAQGKDFDEKLKELEMIIEYLSKGKGD